MRPPRSTVGNAEGPYVVVDGFDGERQARRDVQVWRAAKRFQDPRMVQNLLHRGAVLGLDAEPPRDQVCGR